MPCAPQPVNRSQYETAVTGAALEKGLRYKILKAMGVSTK
jgi:hypothetical protein